MNLLDLFDLSFVGRRDSTALEFVSGESQPATYTFGDLDARSNRMARLLEARGLKAGDRLCTYLVNSCEVIDLYLACLKLGVIWVPINILYREREIAHILTDAQPCAVIAADAAPLPDTDDISFWPVQQLARATGDFPATRPRVALDGDAPAAIVYTSGTTGASKGAILTHNNFAANALNLLTCWQISSADRFLLSLPLFHVHGLGNGLHCWLISGCRTRLLERFAHQKASEIFCDFRPTLFFGVPTIYVRLLETPAPLAKQIRGFVRLFVSGSAPLPAQVLEDFQHRFGHTILERYGMTETLMNISNPYTGERRAGTVGLPLPSVSIRLVDPEGNSVPDEEMGELYVRGPNVFAGYWRRQEETRAAFVDGYFRTGDLAVRASDGYYTLSGRKSELIISGGFNVYPREIEEYLQEQDEVAEAAVVGRPDRLRGEVPVAYIVPRSSFDPDRLESRCRAKLASFKVPRAFLRVESLPRTALGKVQKHLLPNDKLDKAGNRG